jgi:hypothetical protein
MSNETAAWSSPFRPLRRLVPLRLRGQWVRCDQCRKRLSYQVGSIEWGCLDRDLCGACAGSKAGQFKTEVLSRDSLGWTAKVTSCGTSRIVRVGSISSLIRDKSDD